MKTYEQNYLGYDRAKTNAWLTVAMPDGTLWKVPVQAIVDSRDEECMVYKEDTVKSIRDKSLSREYSITAWAVNYMNWDDVEEYAVQIPTEIKPTDFQEGWINGDKNYIGEI